MGSKFFLWPKIDKEIYVKTEKIFKNVSKEIKNKRDLENLKIYGVWIGDLIYDSYLKFFNEETINIKSLKFKEYLKDEISLFLFWQKYINKNDVKALIISHSVYSSNTSKNCNKKI